MWKALWALITRPTDLAVPVGRDQKMAKVFVQLVMPLSLQLFCKQAGVGANPILLLVLLLWYTVTAALMPYAWPADQHACINPSQQ